MHKLSKNETFLSGDFSCDDDDAKHVGPMMRLAILALSFALPLAGTYSFSERFAVDGKPAVAALASMTSSPNQSFAFVSNVVEQELDAKN